MQMNLNSYLKKCLKNKEFRECFIQDIKELEQELNVKILEEDKENLNSKKQLKENITVKTFEEKAQALLDYLAEDDLTLEDCREGYDENIIELEDGREYIVCDYDTAKELAKEDIVNFIDDQGIEGFTPNFREWILENAIDEDKLKDIFEEDLNEYYYEYDLEELVDEALYYNLLSEDEVYEEVETDWGTDRVIKDGIDEDELREKIIEYKVENEDAYNWFEGMLSGSDLAKFFEDNKLIDYDKIAEEAIEWDGIAHFIAGYDGEELELDGDLYAYRTN